MERPVSTDSIGHPGTSSLFAFPHHWREGVYQAIYRRRDVRRFRPDPVPPEVLARVLHAAHHAPSVGFMQPWNFIVVSDRHPREQVQDLSSASGSPRPSSSTSPAVIGRIFKPGRNNEA